MAVVGQAMPGGGLLAGVDRDEVSPANELGQRAFVGRLHDGRTALYRVDADGTVSLILMSGTLTDQGRVTDLGIGGGGSFGESLNSRGQMAVGARPDGVDTLLLITPMES